MKPLIRASHLHALRAPAFLVPATLVLTTLVLTTPLFAGVVYEIELKDHAQSPPKTESIEMAAEGRHLKMGIAGGGGGQDGEMIFRGDRREVVVINDRDQAYHVVDRELIQSFQNQGGGAAMDDQLATARKELEKRLGKMTPEQRRALEGALGQPRGGAANIFGQDRPESELRKTGERATKNGYPCVRYDILRGGEKVRELWITDWNQVEGGGDVRSVFRDMASFFAEMMDAGFKDRDGDVGFFEHMDEIDGFPVVSRGFEDDALTDEWMLRSSRRQQLDPDAFEPPSGYKRQEMFGGR